MKRFVAAILTHIESFGDAATRVRVKRSGSSSSVYITVDFAEGGQETIRVSDHKQPEFGAFDKRRGYRMESHTIEYIYGADSIDSVRKDLNDLFAPQG